MQDVHAVRCLNLHPCGDFLFVGTNHQAVRVYDLQTLKCFTAFDQASHVGKRFGSGRGGTFAMRELGEKPNGQRRLFEDERD